MDRKIADRESRVAARPILEEYDLATVDDLGVNRVEFGKLADSTTLWKW